MVWMAAPGVLVFMTAVMFAGWLVQRRLQNGGWSDVFWTSGTGFALVACALAPIGPLAAPPERQWLVAAMVAIWSLRLGVHIARRVAHTNEDARYAEMRAGQGARFQRAMLGLMLVQAPVSALLALAVLAAAHAPGPLGVLDIAGVLVIAAAIAGEGVADEQLNRFKARPDSAGRVCDQGLWAWSRHPNYVFEWLGWLAYPIIALRFGLDRPWVWLALAAPIVMYLLLTKVSGVPPLERAMLASRGESYRRYQARVPVFFPRLRSGSRT